MLIREHGREISRATRTICAKKCEKKTDKLGVFGIWGFLSLGILLYVLLTHNVGK
jgi:hypothetical protein